jgi:acetolactate synthase-1/3 small subunit
MHLAGSEALSQRREDSRDHTILALVENKEGVLARVTGLFSARGYGIESICMGKTLDPSLARMTIVVRGDDAVIERVIKQLQRLIDVIKVADLTNVDHVEREMVLVRVAPTAADRAEVLRIADIFRARVVDVSPVGYALEMTGEEKKVEAILELLKPFEIREIVRTGKIALARARKDRKVTAPDDALIPARRKHPRHALSFEVRLGSVDELARLWTQDISQGGMSVQTEREIPIGTRVELRLVHPQSSESFAVHAMVRRQIDQPGFRGIGVEFVDLDRARKKALTEFIRCELLSEDEFLELELEQQQRE